MKRILSIALILGAFVPMVANAEPVIDGAKRINVTAYTASADAITASGEKVRKGICAAADDLLYDSEYFTDEPGTWVAMVWTSDGAEFLGYYEVLDRGGTQAIRKGNVIDIFCDDLDECTELMALTKGKVLVKYVKSVG